MPILRTILENIRLICLGLNMILLDSLLLLGVCMTTDEFTLLCQCCIVLLCNKFAFDEVK